MKFLYTAKTQKGEVQTGVIQAGTRESAIATLHGFGLIVIQLQEEKGRSWSDILLAGFRRTGIRDISIFTRQLATLLEAEVPLVDSMRTMFQQTTNPYLKEAVFEVLSDVEAGSSLSQALSRHEGVFSQFYVQMVRSAEITGRLQEVFSYLADYLEAQALISTKIRGAMIYPVFILSLFFSVVVVMVLVVIPQLRQVFSESGISIEELPFVTRILFGTGDFMSNYGTAALLSLIVAVFAIRAHFKTREGKTIIDLAVLRLPIFGEIAKKVYLSRFSETTSVLIKGDIPVAQALEVAGDVVGNVQYRYLIFEAAEAVRRGEQISQALSRFPNEFPPLVSQMIAIGEKTGRLDELMHRVSEFYNREVERVLANAVELIQPTLIVVLGIFVGLLIGAIILPIYQLSQAI